MPKYLDGMALAFYKGIGPDLQQISRFEDFNFFIGENNAGKSTILSFLSQHISAIDKSLSIPEIDKYRGTKTGHTLFGVGITQHDFMQNCLDGANSDRRIPAELLRRVICFLCENGLIWLAVNFGDRRAENFSFLGKIETLSLQGLLSVDQWDGLWYAATGGQRGSLESDWIPGTLRWMLRCQRLNIPEIRFVPAIRQIGGKDTAFADYTGNGLINRLAELQNPEHDRRFERDHFNKINKFLQNITGKDDAEIEIPYSRDHVLVHMDNKVLPLASLGTGVHEVIMLAAFCTLSEECIVCIEEPEIHLHPVLQKKLIRYLIENTRNQYFIATHSASFIDTPGAAVFHVSNDGSQTTVRNCDQRGDRFQLCQQLGYRASDIMQSNVVIWVEGPSDRIYLNHWINSVAPDLVEGIHYSIMFYGGRLLSHLSADEEDVQRFIDLRSLNRNIVVLIDSDKKSDDDTINSTKQRIASEFQDTYGMCWITKGREIENYVSHNELQKAVSQRYANYEKASLGGQYDHALFYHKNSDEDHDDTLVKTIDKIGVAERVCAKAANLDVLDLRDRVNELVSLIRRAN